MRHFLLNRGYPPDHSSISVGNSTVTPKDLASTDIADTAATFTKLDNGMVRFTDECCACFGIYMTPEQAIYELERIIKWIKESPPEPFMRA